MPPHAPDFLAIVGPTASGKTRLSIEVADVLGGEVISMDSRQVYRGMDIGTAKVGLVDRARVPHFGLDIRDPDETYSAGQFGRDARRWIVEIRARGHVPVVVGGTGFFLRVLLDPIFQEPEMAAERREALRAWLRTRPQEDLVRWARALDPARAELAAEGGPQRLERTLSVALLTGRPLSWWHEHAAPEADPLTGVVVAIEWPRPELDRRIDDRVGDMLKDGLVDEVRRLVEAGYERDAPGMTGTGYREILNHLDGEWSLDQAADAIRGATRKYARRQMTWIRGQLEGKVHTVQGEASLEAQVASVVDVWRGAVSEGTGSVTGEGAERA